MDTGELNDHGEAILEGDTISQLIVSAYFAITTLSTVGYGDMYPISELEKIIVVIVMLSGVAFFSYIMGNFIEIISSYEQKMGFVDKSKDLDMWMIELQRFNNKTPLKISILEDI
jgi:voltage-gated potassium channel Kch